MCVDMESLSYISGTVLSDVNAPIVCMCIDNVKAFGKIQRRLFFANESHVYLFEQKAITKYYTQVFCDNYVNLQKIHLPDPQTLILTFSPNNFQIEIQNEIAQQMTTLLVLYIYSALTNREMPEVELYDFDYTLLSHSYLSFYNRFRFLCFKNGKEPNREILNKMRKFCLSNSQELDTLSIDTSGEYTKYILESLQIEPNITTLIVQTPRMGTMWKEVAQMFRTNTTITTFISYEKLTKSFADIPKAFQENERLKLKKFLLMRAVINPTYIQIFSDIVISHQFEQFGIINSLSDDKSTLFLNSLNNNPSFQSLFSLTLDGTRNLDIYLLLRSINTISSLSIANCNIELSLFFGFLELVQDLKLISLNLTGNKATQLIKDNTKLPNSLEEIRVEYIAFKDDNLLRLMKLLTQKPMKIDASRAILDETKWNHFFDNIDLLPTDKITSLNWSENAIYLEFIDFLDTCTTLESLYLNGCFGKGDSLILKEFSKFVSASTTLKEVSATGTPKKTFGDDELLLFLKGFATNRSVLSIDISNQAITSKSLNPIKYLLLTNRKIEKMKIGTHKLYRPEFLLKFYQLLAPRGTPLTLDFPSSDIILFQENQMITRDFLSQIHEAYDLLLRGDPSVKVPKGSIQREKEVPKPAKRVTMKNKSVNQSDELMGPTLDLDSFLSHLESNEKTVGVLLQECQTKPPPEEPSDYDVVQPKILPHKQTQIMDTMKEKYNSKSLFERIQKTFED